MKIHQIKKHIAKSDAVRISNSIESFCANADLLIANQQKAQSIFSSKKTRSAVNKQLVELIFGV